MQKIKTNKTQGDTSIKERELVTKTQNKVTEKFTKMTNKFQSGCLKEGQGQPIPDVPVKQHEAFNKVRSKL